MNILFVINNFAAAAWLWAWTNAQLGWSVLLIIVQLASLALIHIRLGIYNPNRSISSRVFTQFPLSIYFGWISIATVANIAAYLVYLDWQPVNPGPVTWTRLLIAAAVLMGILFVFTRKNVFYGLVLVWALHGIIRERTRLEPEQYPEIVRAAWIGIAILALSITIQWMRNFSYKRSRNSYPLASSPSK